MKIEELIEENLDRIEASSLIKDVDFSRLNNKCLNSIEEIIYFNKNNAFLIGFECVDVVAYLLKYQCNNLSSSWLKSIKKYYKCKFICFEDYNGFFDISDKTSLEKWKAVTNENFILVEEILAKEIYHPRYIFAFDCSHFQLEKYEYPIQFYLNSSHLEKEMDYWAYIYGNHLKNYQIEYKNEN